MKNNRNEKIGFKLQIIKIAKNCGMQLKQCLMEYLWPLMYILAKNQEARKKGYEEFCILHTKRL